MCQIDLQMATFHSTIFPQRQSLKTTGASTWDREQPDERVGDTVDGVDEGGDPVRTCPKTAPLKTDVVNRKVINAIILVGSGAVRCFTCFVSLLGSPDG